jgi:hypothetical protein
VISRLDVAHAMVVWGLALRVGGHVIDVAIEVGRPKERRFVVVCAP